MSGHRDAPSAVDAASGSVVSTDAFDHQIYHRNIRPDPDDPQLGVLYAIGGVEECDVEDLPPLYDYVDHLVEHRFDEPPATEAQVELSFTYYNYRVTVDQEGNLRLRRLAEPLEIE